MGKILAIYSDSVFKEYILPSLNNSDYVITINRFLFCLEKDIHLQLEVIENEWKFKQTDTYRVTKDRTLYEDVSIQAEDFLQIVVGGKEILSVVVIERPRVFVPYTKYSLRNKAAISLGRSEANTICYHFREFVSKKHATIRCENGEYVIIDESINGIYVNGNRISNQKRLEFGDYINLVGLHMVYLGDILAIDTSNPGVQINEKELPLWQDSSAEETVFSVPSVGKKMFHRSPRAILSIEKEPITIEAPPAPDKPEQMPLMMSIGPALTMAFPMLLSCMMMIVSTRMTGGASRGLMMYTGLIMAVSSAVIGIFWNLKNQSYQKKKNKEKEIHRFEAYSSYLLKKTDEIKAKYEHNIKAMKERYVSAEECVSYTSRTKELWGRNSLHEDFLTHRIGIGDIPFQVPIQVPADKFTLVEDSLTEKPKYIYDNYKTLFQVPITIDLKKNQLIGVVGGKNKHGALQISRNLAAQIAANNCYTDVKMGFAYEESNSADSGQWDYASWFPHVWSEDHKCRFVANEKNECSEVFFALANILRQREELLGSNGKEMEFKPHFVLFVSDPALLEGELLAKYIFESKKNLGLTTILLVEDRMDLPNSCRFIIENTAEFAGFYDAMAGENDRMSVAFDDVSKERLEQFSRLLSNVEVMEVEEGGELPSGMTFFDMYHVKSLNELNVIERWKKNRTYDNIRGLLGEKSGGKECYLDVHEKYHGPHGLVAGTTGSGKSETLQTYLLSLAVNYSPYDIGFFIIDYKGGGMANLFDGLPHLIGSISNLSGNQVHRAMVSIKSENRRRQRIFNENGVNNINLYTKLYKNGEAKLPVPHLFIVIDEFAELKREEPDFMRELISVAQVGRSLGVHLILATQKPSGTVDDNIWSNSKFRICLRVQDRQDSNDMLHKPDAAYITQAGRAYLQVGNDEVYELFQSGYSGAVYVDDDTISKTDIASLLTITGREEIKGTNAKNAQKLQLLRKWMGVLLQVYEDAIETVVDASNRDQVVSYLYSRLEQMGIEYPKSDFNTARLFDFMDVADEAKTLEGDVITNLIQITTDRNVKLPQQKDKTQLDAVKEYLGEVAAENGYDYNLKLWLPVLPQYLYLDDFEEYRQTVERGIGYQPLQGEWNMRILIGKVDDPRHQAQMPHYIDIAAEGHMAVCGSVTSGKSTFIQSLMYSMIHTYSPQYVNIYGIDFSSKMMSAFEQAPHVGGIMYEDDFEKIAKCFNMIGQLLKVRKGMFHGGNYSQYVKVNGVQLPAIFIVIDNFSAFNEKTEEKYLDFLIQLSKEGVNVGIFLIIGAAGIGRTEIPSRLAENILNIIALQQADKFGYGELLKTMQFDVIPETGIKGRGLVNHDGSLLEFQTALAIEATDDYQRMEKIEEECRLLRQRWDGPLAKAIPVIPEKPIWSEFAALDDVISAAKKPNLVPVGYNAENADVYSVNLRHIYCYLIMGAMRTGKKNYLKVMIESSLLKDKAHVCIIDTPAQLLRGYDKNAASYYVNSDSQIFEYMKELTPVFQARNKRKHELEDLGYEEDEIFTEQQKEDPYFIFISDMAWFVETITRSDFQMEGFFQTIFLKGSLHNIYFIAALEQERYRDISGAALFKAFTTAKKGILFGGNAAENSLFSFDYMGYREQSQVQKPGIGLLPSPLYEDEPAKIVVPLVKGKKND